MMLHIIDAWSHPDDIGMYYSMQVSRRFSI